MSRRSTTLWALAAFAAVAAPAGVAATAAGAASPQQVVVSDVGLVQVSNATFVQLFLGPAPAGPGPGTMIVEVGHLPPVPGASGPPPGAVYFSLDAGGATAPRQVAAAPPPAWASGPARIVVAPAGLGAPELPPAAHGGAVLVVHKDGQKVAGGVPHPGIVWSGPVHAAIPEEGIRMRLALDGPADADRLFVRLRSDETQPWTVAPIDPEAGPAAMQLAAPAATSELLPYAVAGGAVAAGLACAKLVRGLRDGEAPIPWPVLALFTRLRRPHLLDQGTRRRVHEAVEAEPGLRFVQLRQRTRLPAGVLTHHLAVLERHGLVLSVRRGGSRHLFPGGAPPVPPDHLGDQARRIVGLLAAAPLGQRELAQRLGLTQQGVSYHLRQLVGTGHVVRERGPSGTWVYASTRRLVAVEAAAPVTA